MKRKPPFALQVLVDAEALAKVAADWLATEVRRQPRVLLGLATGSSPTRTYARLAELGDAEPGLLGRIRALKIDEWGGLAMDDPGTCEVYLQQSVVRPWGLDAARYFGWHSRPADPQAECERVRHWLAMHGPMDVCVLGLGANGHLLLNEPAEFLTPGPHVAELAAGTKRHGMLQNARTQPAFGLTLGMADILQARKILLLVSGAAKAGPLARLLEPGITPQFPASFLWLHPAVTLLCDREAASRLRTPTSD